MRLQIKSGPGAARVSGLRPELVLAAVSALCVLDRHGGYSTVITAGLDGKHAAGSLHYVGLAFDLRCSGVPEEKRAAVLRDLQEDLGADYDVIYEVDHWHVEFQPKQPYTGS